MFENAFKYVDDVLRKDAGCSTALDYVEQSSWVLFLKYLDDLERERSLSATLKNQIYKPIIEKSFRWGTWAAPKNNSGDIDHNLALTGPDLVNFVNSELWPYLAEFKDTSEDPETLEYKIGEIFSEVRNKLQSGYNLREILNRFDSLKFESADNKHEMSSLYEDKIKGMGNAGRNGGEYYTPRPLIRAMVKIINPKIGERVYDPACGSAGFLVEAFHHMWDINLTTSQIEFLQKKTFLGKEVKSLAYIVGTMNMILHGIEAPRIIHSNTLSENVMQIQEKDRFDVILANPPFGGSERPEVQQNFAIRSGETAYLFLQHFIRSLKAGGRAAIVIKNTFLSNSDAIALRRELLETCDLHTILDCPAGTFSGTGVKTVVLFFEKGRSTQSTWFYELSPGRSLGKRNPLNDVDLAEFVNFSIEKTESVNSWHVKTSSLDKETLELSVQNPNRVQVHDVRQPTEILERIEQLEAETRDVLKSIGELL
jgi:type I restriction enzyme M protein